MPHRCFDFSRADGPRLRLMISSANCRNRAETLGLMQRNFSRVPGRALKVIVSTGEWLCRFVGCQYTTRSMAKAAARNELTAKNTKIAEKNQIKLFSLCSLRSLRQEFSPQKCPNCKQLAIPNHFSPPARTVSKCGGCSSRATVATSIFLKPADSSQWCRSLSEKPSQRSP